MTNKFVKFSTHEVGSVALKHEPLEEISADSIDEKFIKRYFG